MARREARRSERIAHTRLVALSGAPSPLFMRGQRRQANRRLPKKHGRRSVGYLTIESDVRGGDDLFRCHRRTCSGDPDQEGSAFLSGMPATSAGMTNKT